MPKHKCTPESDLWCEDSDKLCEMLSKFIAEARQSSGEAYTPKTLLQLMNNLQAFEYTIYPRACHFMNHKDTIEEENEFWDKGVWDGTLKVSSMLCFFIVACHYY